MTRRRLGLLALVLLLPVIPIGVASVQAGTPKSGFQVWTDPTYASPGQPVTVHVLCHLENLNMQVSSVTIDGGGVLGQGFVSQHIPPPGSNDALFDFRLVVLPDAEPGTNHFITAACTSYHFITKPMKPDLFAIVAPSTPSTNLPTSTPSPTPPSPSPPPPPEVEEDLFSFSSLFSTVLSQGATLTQAFVGATAETVATSAPSPAPEPPSAGGDETSAIAALRAKYAACIASKSGPAFLAEQAVLTSTGSDNGTFTIEIKSYTGDHVGTWEVAPSGSVTPVDDAATSASSECPNLAS